MAHRIKYAKEKKISKKNELSNKTNKNSCFCLGQIPCSLSLDWPYHNVELILSPFCSKSSKGFKWKAKVLTKSHMIGLLSPLASQALSLP